MLGLGKVARKVFGTPNDRKVKATRPLVEKINALEAEFEMLDDAQLIEKTAELKARTGAQRVAEFLLTLGDCDESGACEVRMPYDKVLIAGRLGMKPESLSRAFAKLKGHGVTIKQNRALIDDLESDEQKI